MPRERSQDLYRTARTLFPGGVNSPARAWTAVGGDPFTVARGQGSRVFDVDGNQYIDYVASWGPLILGHAHPDVLESVSMTAANGMSFGAPTEHENELARMVIKALPSIDMIRFVNSGTEAGMSALRLARAFTGRDKIIKFQGGYHGHADTLLVEAGSGAAAHGVPNSAGVTHAISQDTLIAQYNDLDSVERILREYPNRIAGVIVEPIAANMGVVPPQAGFLEGLRTLTTDAGAMLIFDEIVTGFRVMYGGAQELYNVKPDITCLGKIIGGGLPVGAYGGRRDIMETISPLGPMYQAGTLSGNPVTMAAGTKTLQVLQQPGVYDTLESKGRKLEVGFRELFQKTKTPMVINRVGSMMTLFFSESQIEGWRDVSGTDKHRFSRLFHQMLAEGVYLPPSPFEAMFVSTAHTNDDIDETLEAAERALVR